VKSQLMHNLTVLPATKHITANIRVSKQLGNDANSVRDKLSKSPRLPGDGCGKPQWHSDAFASSYPWAMY